MIEPNTIHDEKGIRKISMGKEHSLQKSEPVAEEGLQVEAGSKELTSTMWKWLLLSVGLSL